MTVVRKQDRLRLPNDPDREFASYFFESLDYPVIDRRTDAYLAEFHLQSNPHSHAGPEFIYVVRGQMVVTLDGCETELAEGDSLYFESTFPHSYRPKGRGACSAVVVVARA